MQPGESVVPSKCVGSKSHTGVRSRHLRVNKRRVDEDDLNVFVSECLVRRQAPAGAGSQRLRAKHAGPSDVKHCSRTHQPRSPNFDAAKAAPAPAISSVAAMEPMLMISPEPDGNHARHPAFQMAAA